jgi:hypothetical protein
MFSFISQENDLAVRKRKDTDLIENDASNNYSILVCTFVTAINFYRVVAEQRTHTNTQNDGRHL